MIAGKPLDWAVIAAAGLGVALLTWPIVLTRAARLREQERNVPLQVSPQTILPSTPLALRQTQDVLFEAINERASAVRLLGSSSTCNRVCCARIADDFPIEIPPRSRRTLRVRLQAGTETGAFSDSILLFTDLADQPKVQVSLEGEVISQALSSNPPPRHPQSSLGRRPPRASATAIQTNASAFSRHTRPSVLRHGGRFHFPSSIRRPVMSSRASELASSLLLTCFLILSAYALCLGPVPTFADEPVGGCSDANCQQKGGGCPYGLNCGGLPIVCECDLGPNGSCVCYVFVPPSGSP